MKKDKMDFFHTNDKLYIQCLWCDAFGTLESISHSASLKDASWYVRQDIKDFWVYNYVYRFISVYSVCSEL